MIKEGVLQFSTRSSGGQKTWAVLIRDGHVVRDFGARFIRRVSGWEEWEFAPQAGEKVLLLYRSGSGATQSVTDVATEKYWDSFALAEKDLGVKLS